jgi:hypothetical protein
MEDITGPYVIAITVHPADRIAVNSDEGKDQAVPPMPGSATTVTLLLAAVRGKYITDECHT